MLVFLTACAKNTSMTITHNFTEYNLVETNDCTIAAAVPRSLRDAIDDEAKKTSKPKSTVIREIMEAWNSARKCQQSVSATS